jgi:hypothetical protein
LQNSPVFPRQLSIASVPAGEHQHYHARAASPRSGAVVRDFKKRAFPMAEERWSVALAGFIQRLSEQVASLKIK